MQNSIPSCFVIRDGIHGLGVFITMNLKKGRILFKLKGPVLLHPTRTSIQVSETKHIEDPLGAHVNHSCLPTARVDRWMRALVSTRDLQKGEEITFDYTQNEDRLASPFECECCHQKIIGRKLTV